MRRGGGGIDFTTHHNLEIAELKAMHAVTQQLTRAAEALARAARGGGGGGGLTLSQAGGGGGGLMLSRAGGRGGAASNDAQSLAKAIQDQEKAYKKQLRDQEKADKKQLREEKERRQAYDKQLHETALTLGAFATIVVTGALAVQRFSQQLATAGAVALSTGGTRGQVAGLSTTLAAAGISAEEIPGIAARVRALRGGGRAAAELGFQPSREIAPDLNEAAGLQEVVRQILDPLISEETALGKARLAELEQLLELRQIQREHGSELAKEAEFRRQLADPQATHNATEFNYQLRNISGSFSELGQAFGQLLLPGLNFILQNLADSAKGWALIADWLAGIFGFKKPGGAAPGQAQHTQAVNDNTAALKNLERQWANAGPRTNAAVPAGLGSEALEHFLAGEYFRLGGLAP